MKITATHWQSAKKLCGDHFYVDIANKAIEIAQVEAEQSEFITAEQARALGAGMAELFNEFMPEFGWQACSPSCSYPKLGYKYRAIKQPKPAPVVKKQISWSQMPVGVMTNKGEFRGAYVDQQGNCMLDIERVAGSGETGVAISAQLPANITLAPASEQKWIAVQDDMPPAYEMLQQLFAKGINAMASGERFKVTGIESGYELGGN